jgi:hypothetical protein
MLINKLNGSSGTIQWTIAVTQRLRLNNKLKAAGYASGCLNFVPYQQSIHFDYPIAVS